MKLVLGYIAAFLLMTVVGTAILYGMFAFAIGAISFVTWSLPGNHVDWLTALRVCISAGSILGAWYICSKEGNEMAKDFVDDYLD
jgi:uncharacterized membrane protein YfcA